MQYSSAQAAGLYGYNDYILVGDSYYGAGYGYGYDRQPFSYSGNSRGLAGFVDTAKAWRGIDPTKPSAEIDVGAGVRFRSGQFGGVRLDVGYGVRDGRWAISTGFLKEWPRW